MTNTLWPADRVAELAVLLRGFRPGKWTEADLSQGAVAQGWEWSAGELGPILHAGRPFGEGQLLPVDDHMDIHVTTEEYTGLHFPLGRVEGGVREQVEAFRETGRALRERLGEPNVIGSDDPDDPLHGSAPGWGAPFLRWRGRANSLELRVSGGDWAPYTGPVRIAEEGVHRIEARATDRHGLTGATSREISVDTAPPVSRATVKDLGASVEITLHAEDGVSGVERVQWEGPGTFWGTFQEAFVRAIGPEPQVIEFAATDRAGNEEPRRRLVIPGEGASR